MVEHWRAAALSPIPHAQGTPAEKAHLMEPVRRFGTLTSLGQPTKVEIQGHSNGVLGHSEDASAHWNRIGHTQSRADNMLHNRQASTYHGIEEARASAASGSSAAGYRSPSPSSSHRSNWDPMDPNFKPGHFHPYRLVAQTAGSAGAAGPTLLAPIATLPPVAGTAPPPLSVGAPARPAAMAVQPTPSAGASVAFTSYNLRPRPNP